MRTCTVMTYTNGWTTTYTVFRGKMRGRLFDAHKAEVVDQFTITGDKRGPLYWEPELTHRHATPAAPPVYWHRKRPNP